MPHRFIRISKDAYIDPDAVVAVEKAEDGFDLWAVGGGFYSVSFSDLVEFGWPVEMDAFVGRLERERDTLEGELITLRRETELFTGILAARDEKIRDLRRELHGGPLSPNETEKEA